MFIIVAFCRDLPPIDNGVLEYDMMESLFNATRPNGTVATYTCDDGFRLDGNATSYRICDTGNWTATEPACIESKPWVYVCVAGRSTGVYIFSVICSSPVTKLVYFFMTRK